MAIWSVLFPSISRSILSFTSSPGDWSSTSMASLILNPDHIKFIISWWSVISTFWHAKDKYCIYALTKHPTDYNSQLALNITLSCDQAQQKCTNKKKVIWSFLAEHDTRYAYIEAAKRKRMSLCGKERIWVFCDIIETFYRRDIFNLEAYELHVCKSILMKKIQSDFVVHNYPQKGTKT